MAKAIEEITKMQATQLAVKTDDNPIRAELIGNIKNGLLELEKLTAQQTEELIKLIEMNHPALTSLHINLTKDYGHPAVSLKIAKALAKNTILVSVDLYHLDADPNLGKTLYESLRNNKTLRKLSLVGFWLNDVDAQHIAELLKENNTIQNIFLARINFGYPGIAALVTALTKNMSLESFRLLSWCTDKKDKGACTKLINSLTGFSNSWDPISCELFDPKSVQLDCTLKRTKPAVLLSAGAIATTAAGIIPTAVVPVVTVTGNNGYQRKTVTSSRALHHRETRNHRNRW